MLRGNFYNITGYIRKEKMYQLNSLSLHLKLGKEEQTKSRANRRKETQ